ncbi:OsmC family protein [Terrarubrum flagellatum]|uniref:OsmC family protein n=1 Tax=Terrirubrum flagellatum TaxID=2895980 RepID=UPI003144DFA3
MSNLIEYLTQKRAALAARKKSIEDGSLGAQPLGARVVAEGRSGVRRIRIRDFQVITDSPPDFAGYDLGPSSPELQLGVLGSCLNHSFLIQAAAHGVAIHSLEVEVSGQIDPRAGSPGFEGVPVYPHDIAYTVKIVSDAGEAEIQKLRDAVDRACPILNLLRAPQTIKGAVSLQKPRKQGASTAGAKAA